jgi:hypothetical protein
VASRRIETEIDRLYQLPLDEFTAARNALAKEAGTDRAEVRGLEKPPIAAWAVNQLYWKRRDLYDPLIAASTELRKQHKAILSGRTADIREAGKAHDAEVESALKAALALLREGGHPATDSTRQAIMTTLRALPVEEPPGRLTKVLQPGGFEMLAGLSIAGAKGGIASFRPQPAAAKAQTAATAGQREGRREAAKTPEAATTAGTSAQAKAEARKTAQAEAARAKEARAAAAQAVRDAEQALRREQFESARLTREAGKADKEVKEARAALETAQQALEQAESDASNAARQRDAALERTQERERELAAARAAARQG